MQTISVVIPTLWRYQPFAEFVNEVAQVGCVDRIVIVDNNRASRPDICWNHKIHFLDFGQNIFVNPAWNAGTYNCTGDIVCYLNDDVLFDLTLLDIVAAQMSPDHGLWGYFSSSASHSVHIEQHHHQVPTGFGQLFFLHKRNFVDIPFDLLVHCGDYFLFDVVKKKYNSNCLIKGLMFYTPSSVSSTSFAHMYVQACLLYEALRDERKLPPASTSNNY